MANEKKRTAGDVLLELLDFVPDANQLERMLEAENLVRILKAKGRSEDEIREDLKHRMPGDLLLDVLRGGASAEELVALCGPAAPAAKASAAKEPTQKTSSAKPRGDAGVYAPPGETPPPETVYPVTTPFQEAGTVNKV